MIWWKLKGDGEVKLGKIFAPLDKRLSFSFHSIFFRETLESLRIVGGCVYHWIWNLAKIKEGVNAARGQISIMSTIIHFQDRSKQCYVVLWCCLHYDACGAPLTHSWQLLRSGNIGHISHSCICSLHQHIYRQRAATFSCYWLEGSLIANKQFAETEFRRHAWQEE